MRLLLDDLSIQCVKCEQLVGVVAQLASCKVCQHLVRIVRRMSCLDERVHVGSQCPFVEWVVDVRVRVRALDCGTESLAIRI